jgi:hypothetical protein
MMMLSKLAFCIFVIYFISFCRGLSSYSAQPSLSAAARQNQQITRALMGKNKRPMPGSSATFKPEPMEWRQAINFLDKTLLTGFIPDIMTW